MAMKTPGVYIIEKNAFPPSVVEVATAVPAFIGYTKKALNGGKALKNVPFRIASMSEYVNYFGGPPEPVFTIQGPPPADADKKADDKKADKKTDAKASTDDKPKVTAAPGQHSSFSWKGKPYQLSRAALSAGGRYGMYQAMQHFFANGGGACYIVSVGTYEDGDVVSGGVDTKGVPFGLIGGLVPLLKEQEPTMVLTPDAVLLEEPECIKVQQAVLQHCGGRMKNRVAILDVWGGDRDRKDPDFNCIDMFRADIGINHLNFAAAYYPWLRTSLVGPGDVDYRVFGTPAQCKALADVLKADLGLGEGAATDEPDKSRAAALADLLMDDKAWIEKLQKAALEDPRMAEPDKAKAKKDIEDNTADSEKLKDFLAPHKALLHKSLASMSDLYKQILVEARAHLNLMPPAAAMAGLYTMVDNSRGVWKAPANVSVANVTAPAVEISHDDQEDLNVTTQGKSINAIRSFIGEGALVWGARTLDGNSLDWRYVNVRRTMIMLEESCRLAAKAMVFEPNVANTWVTIKSMISNFLTGIWKRGGLAGAVPDDAFSVHVGLGETMTPEDILEGILRVTVLVAIARPAEFIEITFQQQMQKS